MKKDLFALCLSLLLPIWANAETVKMDGIWYGLNAQDNVAEVIKSGDDSQYRGNVIIPQKVMYNGVEYAVTEIGNEAFLECKYLTGITIPHSVANIGDEAFKGCAKLTDVYCEADKVPTTKNGVFDGVDLKHATLHVPESAIDEFKSSAPWSGFRTIKALVVIVEKDRIQVDGLWFELTHEDQTAEIVAAKDSSKYIGNIIIPEKVTHEGVDYVVTSLDRHAFTACSKLTSIHIPPTITHIGNFTFMGCGSLEAVHITDLDAWCRITFESYPSNPLRYAHRLYLNGEEVKDLVIPHSVTSISARAFQFCLSLNSVTIPHSVANIEDGAFEECHNLTKVYCRSEKVPSTSQYAFDNIDLNSVTLHVPEAAIDQYKTTAPWSEFGTMIKICKAPEISYSKGKLTFISETEGAEYISDITCEDIQKHDEAEVTLTATYTIHVYAKKEGYGNSDIATAILCWMECEHEHEGNQTDIIAIPARPVLIQAHDGNVTIQGLAEGTPVAIYTIDGMEMTTGTADCHASITLNTSLKTGDIVLVKMGEKSVKVMMR